MRCVVDGREASIDSGVRGCGHHRYGDKVFVLFLNIVFFVAVSCIIVDVVEFSAR